MVFVHFFDLELLNKEVLAVGAGVWGNEKLISPLVQLKAGSAIAVNLTNHELPMYIYKKSCGILIYLKRMEEFRYDG